MGGVGCAWSLAHDTMQEPNYSKLVVLRCFLKSVVRFARALIAVNERACVRACACVCACVFAPRPKYVSHPRVRVRVVAVGPG